MPYLFVNEVRKLFMIAMMTSCRERFIDPQGPTVCEMQKILIGMKKASRPKPWRQWHGTNLDEAALDWSKNGSHLCRVTFSDSSGGLYCHKIGNTY
jgi:hypothetical protein